MNISSRGRYGLRAMCELAMSAEETKLSLRTIASNQDLPLRYMEHLFAQLKSAGLVESSRGAQGGYSLARRPEEITVREVVSALEGEPSVLSCAGQSCEDECPRMESCLTKPLWEQIDLVASDLMSRITLADLLAGNIPNRKENE
ncbi:MAG: Rrf2 family transcriptional regulator [Tissierellia bacterium]|nr:Rrf2 family transcriptional regulator [Bacillota bacterium]NLL22169.1 Rrf2 family transcriptional regulator [Tissierellia bacterium]